MTDSSKKTILLVEDEAIQALTGKMALEKYGYTVVCANSGEKAVEAVRTEPGIQLILMDIDLGKGMDGTEAAALILQDHDLPIVFLSSHTEQEIVDKTEKITSYGYVVKNSSITVLDASIKMAFKLFEAKKRAAESAEQFRAIVENTSDYIMRYNREGKHIYGNPAALAASGLAREHYIEKTHRELGFSAEASAIWEASITEVFKTGKPKSVEFEVDIANGRAFLQLRFSPEFDSWGGITSVIGVSRDISSLKQTEEDLRTHQCELEMQNEELREKQADIEALRLEYFELYDMAPIAYFTVSEAGPILGANLMAADLLGIVRRNLLTRNFSQVLHADDQDIYFLLRKNLFATGELQHCRLRMRREDGTSFTVYIKAAAAQTGSGERVCRMAVVDLEPDNPQGRQEAGQA